MRKLLVILFLLFAVPSYASPPSRSFTYTSGTVIQSQSVTQNEDAIFNYLQAGVDVYSDGTIVNADIHSSANIQSDKLNLTAIAQSVANSGSTTLTGTFAANGTTNSIGNGGSDVLTLNVPGGMTLSAATTWTLTGALTFSGTIADLGTVTTADINGGTLDNVQIGGTTATGELIVNNASYAADGLGSQGTSGQFLRSAGAGANPTWAEQAITLKSVTPISSANSGNITIEPSKLYKVIISLTNASADDTIGLRFNDDTTGAYSNSIDAATTYLTIGQVDIASANNAGLSCSFDLDTNVINNNRARVHGTTNYYTTAASVFTVRDFGGNWIQTSVTISSFEVLAAVNGATLTGNIYLYEYDLAL